MTTPEMIAAGWAVLRKHQPHGRILGPGFGLVEAYEAMKKLDPDYRERYVSPMPPTE